MKVHGDAQGDLPTSSRHACAPPKWDPPGLIGAITEGTIPSCQNTRGKEDPVLLRVAEVDSKLDDVLGLLDICLEGIEYIKGGRHAGDPQHRLGRKDTRLGTGQTQASLAETPDSSRNLVNAWRPSLSDAVEREETTTEPWMPPPQPEVSEFSWLPSKLSTGRGSTSGCMSTDTDSRDVSPKSGRARVSLFDDSRSVFVESLWIFMEDSESSTWAHCWARGWCMTILASVMVTLLQLTQTPHVRGVQAAALETLFEIAFGVELTLRFLSCPDRKAFIKHPCNVIDFASVCPLVLRALEGFVLPEPNAPPTGFASGLSHFGLLCFVPILRLLKILRRNRVQLKLFETVIASTMETLQFLAFVGMLIIVTSSSMLYAIESRDNIETYGMAVWFSVVTMTTVGYGDVTAVTTAGRCVTTMLMVCSVLFMALPIGVLGNAFAAVWKERDLLLLVDRTRRELDQWGYGTDTIRDVFKFFSGDGSGELSIAGFESMLQEFRVHLSEERVVELFAIFDRDSSGSIDEKEFLRVVFPQTWHKMVQDQKAEEERAKAQKARKAEEQRLRKLRRRRATPLTGTTPPVGSPLSSSGHLIQSASRLEKGMFSNPTEMSVGTCKETHLPNSLSPTMSRQCSGEVEFLPAGLHTPHTIEPRLPELAKITSWPAGAIDGVA